MPVFSSHNNMCIFAPMALRGLKLKSDKFYFQYNSTRAILDLIHQKRAIDCNLFNIQCILLHTSTSFTLVLLFITEQLTVAGFSITGKMALVTASNVRLSTVPGRGLFGLNFAVLHCTSDGKNNLPEMRRESLLVVH